MNVQLLTAAKQGDCEAINQLILDHEHYFEKLVKKIYLPWGTPDDLLQVARIAFTEAIYSFDLQSRYTFLTFATKCINNALINEIHRCTRHKHSLLTEAIELEEHHCPYTLDEIGFSHIFSNYDHLIKEVKKKKLLSKLQLEIYDYLSMGNSIEEIMLLQNRSKKSISSIITRISNKLKEYEANFFMNN